MNTVLIQRDERFQPNGIWVFVNDLDVVRDVLREYDVTDNYGDTGVQDFIDSLEEVPACEESDTALAENGRDGYIGECPESWRCL